MRPCEPHVIAAKSTVVAVAAPRPEDRDIFSCFQLRAEVRAASGVDASLRVGRVVRRLRRGKRRRWRWMRRCTRSWRVDGRAVEGPSALIGEACKWKRRGKNERAEKSCDLHRCPPIVHEAVS